MRNSLRVTLRGLLIAFLSIAGGLILGNVLGWAVIKLTGDSPLFGLFFWFIALLGFSLFIVIALFYSIWLDKLVRRFL